MIAGPMIAGPMIAAGENPAEPTRSASNSDDAFPGV